MSRPVLAALLVGALLLAGCAEPDGGGDATTTPTGGAPTGTTPATGTPTAPTGATPATPATLTPPPAPQADAQAEPGDVPPMAEGEYRATLVTSKGTFVVELYEDKAPLSVANFLQYAQDGHYDGTVFHRVVPGFVIQGGGFAAPFDGASAPKPTHGPIPVEPWEGASHEEGTLGMARTSDPNSGTSQWFVNVAHNPNLDSGYTVFGRVVEGMDVVRAIEQVSTTSKGQFQNVPAEDVVLQQVSVETPAAAGTPALAAFRESYGVAPGGTVSFPLFLKNAGGQRLDARLAGSASGDATVTIERAPGALSAGQAGVAIVEVAAPEGFAGGAVTILAQGAGEGDSVTLRLDAIDASGPVAGDEHPKVSARYVGLYDNGVVFDTTATGLAQRGFPMPSGFREHPDPLKVWVGPAGASDTGGYTPVIEGFKAGIVGLREGETRTVRLTPEEGYQDGNFRVFEMHVDSIDA